MHGSSEVVGPTFMMRLQPFDRRRMTGFAVGLSLCGGEKASVLLSLSPLSEIGRFVVAPLVVFLIAPRTGIFAPSREKEAPQRRSFALASLFPAPWCLAFAPSVDSRRPNFRFGGQPRGRSPPFGRPEAGAHVCVKSKRSKILLGENVQIGSRSSRVGVGEKA